MGEAAMSRLGLLKAAAPWTLARAVESRGLLGTARHAMRRLGAVAGTALIGPETVQIMPFTYYCNHACPMCWLQHVESDVLRVMKRVDKQEGLTLAEYCTLFDGMLPGLREIVLVGGGEPLAHPESVAIMREVKRRRWEGKLVSNGTLLTEPAAQALVDIRWDSTRISVHAGDRDTYRAVQGVDGFEVLRANLKRFDAVRRQAGAERRCGLVVLHVIQPANVATIDKLFEFAEDVGADRVDFELVTPFSDGLRLAADDLLRIEKALISNARASKVPCTLPRPHAFAAARSVAPANGERVAIARERARPGRTGEPPFFVPGRRCSVGFDQAFVTSLGEVKPCCFSTEVMGNIRKEPFRDIWYSARYVDFRMRLIDGRFADYCSENRCTLASVLPY